MLRRVDWAATILLALLGCVHNLVAAPMSFPTFNQSALWFVAGGVTLLFAAAFNYLRLVEGDRPRVRATVFAANLVLLAFVIAFAVVTGDWAQPQGWLLIAAVVWLTVRSASGLSAARQPSTASAR